MSDFVLSAVLELRDRMTGKIKSAAKGLDSVRSMASSASSSLDSASASMARTGESAGRLQRNLSRLGSGRYNIQLNARDMATPAINQVRTSLSQVNGRSASASVRIRDEATSRINRIWQELNSLAGRAYTATVNIRQNMVGQGGRIMNGLSNAASGMAMGAGMQMMGMAGVGYGAYDTVKTYQDFEKQMASVGAIVTADMGEKEAAAIMEQLTAKAREMGAATQFSATEAAKAFEYMGMAGWKAEQMISGIPAVLNLALASGEDLAGVSDIVTDSMTALKIDTRGADADKNIQHFTDVLAAAATHSNTNVAMMGEAFKYAAAPAGLFTDSYENAADVSNDVALALGLMANSGIKASQAGTALRSTLTRMTADTIPTANAMRMLGVDITQAGKDGTEQLKPLRDIFDDLRAKMKEGVSAESLVDYAEALSGTKTRNKAAMIEFANKMAEQGGKLSDKDRAKFAKMFAGEEALSGWLAIMTAKDEDYQDLIKAIDDSEGTAGKMAAIKADTLSGDFEKLKSAWHDLQIEIMSGPASDGLREFISGAIKDVNKFKEYLKDGFDISDVGKLALDIITQLRDKFLELDGVGSILAGGALIAGLYKISSLAASVAGRLKDLAKSPAGTKGAIPEAISDLAANVNNMVVNARSVIVNGRVGPDLSKGGGGATAGGGGGGGGGGSRGTRTGPSASGGGRVAAGAGRMASVGKWAGRLATPLMVAAGAWDVYNVSKENEDASAEAQAQVDSASPSDMAAAIENQKAVEKENTNRLGASVGGTSGALAGGIAGAKVGAAAGGAIGTAFFGAGVVPGAAIGGAVGGIGGAIAGSELGQAIGGHTAEITEAFSSAWESVKAEASNTGEWLSNQFDGVKNSAEQAWQGVKDSAQNEWEYVKNIAGDMAHGIQDKWSGIKDWAATNFGIPIYNTFVDALNFTVGAAALIGGAIGDALAPVVSWINENVWTPIKDSAQNEWEYIRNIVSEKWEGVKTCFSEAAAWFDASVWQPIKEAASLAWQDISSLPSMAAEFVETVWLGVSEWFDASVWQPLSQTAASAWDSITSTAGATWDAISAYFAPAAAWFDSTVWQPISTAVSDVQSAITGAFESAWSSVKGIWSSAASWFESNVIAPVSEAFAKISSIGEGITGIHKIGGNAIGTSYWHGGWTEVNEHGGEIIDLPSGSRIYPHATTMAMLKSEIRGSSQNKAKAPANINQDLRSYTTTEMVGQETGPALLEPILNVLFPESKEPVLNPVLDMVFPEHEPDVFSPEIFNSTEPLSIDGLQPAVADGEADQMPLTDTFRGMISSMGTGFAPVVGNLGRMLGELVGGSKNQSGEETTREASGGNVSVSISGNEFVVREDADIDRIAHELFQLISRSSGNYQWTGG